MPIIESQPNPDPVPRTGFSQLRQAFQNVGIKVIKGAFQSLNFIVLVSGWRLTNNSAEFYTGIFNIGGTVITINNTVDIQETIDTVSTSGGGTVWLSPGTYLPTGHINIPSNVALRGVARSAVIIDFAGQAFSIRSIGSIGTHNINITINNITVQNSTSYGVFLQYLDNSVMDGLDIFDCLYGVYEDNCIAVGLIGQGGFFDGNGTNMKMTNGSANSVYFTTMANSISGHGFEMSDCDGMTILDTECSDNFADGINLTNCTEIAYISLGVSRNGGQGIELVSGNNDNQFNDMVLDDNTSDGIKLTATSDRNAILGVSIKNSGGYGINIAASSCDNNQIISPAFDNNALGDINNMGSNTTILPANYSFTAAMDITAGMPLGASNLLDNNVAKAITAITGVASGITSPLDTGGNNFYCAIGGDKFVYLQRTAAGSDTLFAQVGSFNRATQVLTLGTAASVATAFTPNNNRNMTVSKLDTDKFIVFYMADASATNLLYRIGTVSGTNITFGSATTFVAAGSTLATSESFGADFLSTDKGVMYYKAATATNSRIIVFTASGTVATAGTPVQPGTNSDNNDVSAVRKIGTDKFVLVTHSATNSVYAQVGTCVGGTTITNGSEVQISTIASSSAQNAFRVVSPATDVFVVTFPKDTSANNLVACTVLGTIPTPGTSILSTASISTSQSVGLYAQSASIIYLFYQGNSNQRAFKFTLSGTTLAEVGVAMYGSDLPAADITVSMDNGYFAILSLQNNTTPTFFYQGMSYNFLGFAQSSVSRGTSLNVLITGIDSNQSNLIAGGYYQVSNGALTLIDPSNTASKSLNQLQVVKAISPTQVVI